MVNKLQKQCNMTVITLSLYCSAGVVAYSLFNSYLNRSGIMQRKQIISTKMKQKYYN